MEETLRRADLRRELEARAGDLAGGVENSPWLRQEPRL